MRITSGIMMLALMVWVGGCADPAASLEDEKAAERKERREARKERLELQKVAATSADCNAACDKASKVLGASRGPWGRRCLQSCRFGPWSRADTACVAAASAEADLARCDGRLGQGGVIALPPDIGARRVEELVAADGALDLPATTAWQGVGDHILVGVSRRSITVDGIPVAKVACSVDGRPCRDAEDGTDKARFDLNPIDAQGFLIKPLAEALRATIKEGKDTALNQPEALRGRITAGITAVNLVVDRRIPYSVLAKLVYTTAMSEIHDVRLVVRSGQDGLRVVTFHAPRISVGSLGRTREHKRLPAELTVLAAGQRLRVVWNQIDGRFREPVIGLGPTGGTPNMGTLYSQLVRAKARFAAEGGAESRVRLSMAMTTPTGTVAQIAGAAACMRPEPSYASLTTYLEAPLATENAACLAAGHPHETVPGDGVCVRDKSKVVPVCKPLFPDVVLTVPEDMNAAMAAPDGLTAHPSFGRGGFGFRGTGQSGMASLGHKPAKKVAKVKLGRGRSTGFCKKGDIARAVRRRANSIRACYEQRLQVNPELSGKVTARWTVGLNGRVQKASTAGNTLGDGAVTSCILRVIRRMRFPRPEGGICIVQWPFVFNSGG